MQAERPRQYTAYVHNALEVTLQNSRARGSFATADGGTLLPWTY